MNQKINNILARYRDEDASNYTNTTWSGYNFIDTAGHGYLVISSEEKGYSEACEIARQSNFSWKLDGGLVYLEEDCDAPQFISKMKNKYIPQDLLERGELGTSGQDLYDIASEKL